MPGKRKVKVPVARFAARMVRCGKAECKKCPHGPYWYEVTRVGGKRRLRYIGKKRPSGLACVEVKDHQVPPR